MTAPVHRLVRHEDALDFCRVGWLPLPSLDGTCHGQWSVHLAWLCECPIVQPKTHQQAA